MFGNIDMNNIKSMLQKEFKQLFRDPKLRIMVIVPPILMLLIFGYAVNTDVNKVRFAVLDEEKSAMSREVIEKFTASEYFTCYAYVFSPKGAVKMLDRGEIDFFLQIDKNFSRKIRKGLTAEIQVIVDGTDSSRASVIVSYINLVMNDFTLKHMKERVRLSMFRRKTPVVSFPGSVILKERIFFNQNLASINFYLPGVIGLLISLFTIMLTSMSIVKERESGTIEQINVSPLHPFEYIMGKLIPFAIIAFVDIIVITIIAISWFRVPFRGSFIFLLLCGMAYILAMLAIGLYISTSSTTQQQAMLSSFLFFIPAILFSGFIFPIYSMPWSIQLVTWLNPLTYFMTIIRGIFLKGVGFTVLWPDLFLLLAIGVSLVFLSVKRYSKRME